MEDRRRIDIKPGDTVRVWQKIEEKGKIRLQAFEGIVLARKHGSEPGATFTVRRVSGGYGVEKIFPLYSPNIDKIEIVRRAKVRRAKLYHIREKAAREIKRQMRNMRFVDIATASDMEERANAEKEAEIDETAPTEPEQQEETPTTPEVQSEETQEDKKV